jgi:hypothetical protein
MTLLHTLLERLALWGLLGQLVGALLIAYGFQPSPDSGMTWHPASGGSYPHLVLRGDRPWAYRLGWVLVVVGIVLQMVPEVCSALRVAR